MILPDLVARRAKSDPNRTALIFRDAAISYAELDDRIGRCAAGLAALGIKKGSAFGLVLRNCPEFVVLALGLSRVGGVVVPINFLEKPDRIALILDDAKAVGVLTAKEFYRNVHKAAKHVKSLKHVFLKDGASEKARDFSDLLAPAPLADAPAVKDTDLMMLLYTSGTTGLPKGVMLTHKNFLTNVEQCLGAIDLRESDRFLCLLPLFHSFSWTTCMLLPLYLGAQIVVIESLLPFDPVIKAVWKHKVTLFVAVPQIYSALAAKIRGAKALVVRLLNPVRVCISGAAPLPAPVLRNFEKNLGVPLLEGYGLTETSPVSALNPLKKRKIGSVGLPLPGVQIEIRDDENRPVPKGQVGEICIKGDHVMSGYYRKPKETKEAFSKDGWLLTGDLGRFDDDGYLTIVDRKKDLIIVKGLNVYPQDVENVIIQHKAVKEAAVVGIPDPDSGDETIRAFVTAKEGMEINKAEIFALCREHLAPYKRPKDVVVLKEMPKNALQKILKKELRKY